MNPIFSDKRHPGFIVGVTGNMDPVIDGGQLDELKLKLRGVFEFLRGGRSEELESGRSSVERMTKEGLSQIGLERWKGLGAETPIVLVSSFAPGVDQIAVEVALDMGISVRCALPYPLGLYERSSTFQNDEQRAKFRDLLDRSGGDAFQIYLAEDLVEPGSRDVVPFSPEGQAFFRRKVEREIQEPNLTQRRKRYRAAGEYIAAFSHALVAVSDAEDAPVSDYDNSPGARGIIEAKRRGVATGLLPLSSSFTWADCGPTFHLHHARLKADPGRLTTEASGRMERGLRVLYPYNVMTGDAVAELLKGDGSSVNSKVRRNAEPWRWRPIGGTQPDSATIASGSLFCLTADNLRRFNETLFWEKASGILEQEIPSLAKANARPGSELGNYTRHYEALASVRKLAGSQKTRITKRSLSESNNALFEKLIVFAFVSAVLFHLFAHWHPFHGEPEGHEAAVAPAPSSGADPHLAQSVELADVSLGGTPPELGHDNALGGVNPYFIRATFGLVGLSLTGVALYSLRRHKLSDIESCSNDFRALAEGIRVQFFWSISGVYRSVAANYMQRQRDELNWLRFAISSLFFPYESHMERFQALSKRDQLQVFRAVREDWLAKQLKYFHVKSKAGLHQLHVMHTVGSGLAIAGLLHVFMVAAFWFVPPFKGMMKHPHLPSWILYSAGVCILVLACNYFRLWRNKEGGHGSPRWLVIYEALALHGFADWIGSKIVKTRARMRSIPLPTDKSSRAVAMNAESIWCVATASFLAVVSLCAILLLSQIPNFPGPVDWAIVFMGTFLVSGALTIAYAERALLSETSFQYKAMSGLYFSALVSLDELLLKLEALLHLGEGSGTQSDAEFSRLRAEVQELLFTVGKEGLAENAEWLILHRARPLEPVLGG